MLLALLHSYIAFTFGCRMIRRLLIYTNNAYNVSVRFGTNHKTKLKFENPFEWESYPNGSDSFKNTSGHFQKQLNRQAVIIRARPDCYPPLSNRRSFKPYFTISLLLLLLLNVYWIIVDIL